MSRHEWIATTHNTKGSAYILEGQIVEAHPRRYCKLDLSILFNMIKECRKNENILKTSTKDAHLYESNVLKLYWKENMHCMKDGEFSTYKNR